MTSVDINELRATVDRLEQRFRGSRVKTLSELMSVYYELIPRFQTDLEDERDQLLSRGGALMLVQGWSTCMHSEN